MPSPILHETAKAWKRAIPEIRPGYTLRVHERIQEGAKERIQVFEGLVISVHKGHVATDGSFTVRRIVSGVGVEKVFPMLATTIEKIEVKKVAKTRRAKLNFLRGRSGKAARLSERFTTDDEFAIAVAPAEAKAVEPVAEAAPEVKAEEVKEETAKS